jgi:hypothetical protein
MRKTFPKLDSYEAIPAGHAIANNGRTHGHESADRGCPLPFPHKRAYHREVKAYLCTYCHKKPTPGELRGTREAAKSDPLLRKFLKEYDRSYYDWGDDPSFFAAQHLLGDVRKASWGVCRPDVRKLEKGDLVVFFCGRQEERVWRYYFVGFGTVRETFAPRDCLWTCPTYAKYRDFYNVLVGPDGARLEKFHPFHDDWQRRADAPYVIFDGALSSFNLSSPRCVATWDGRSIPEEWHCDRRSKKIEQLLFVEREIDRRLRTSAKGHPHPKLNLLRTRGVIRPGRSLPELAKALSRLVKG